MAGVMSAQPPLRPVRGWEPKFPRRGFRCLRGRHVTAEVIFSLDGSGWGVAILHCKRCKRPIDVTAKNSKAAT